MLRILDYYQNSGRTTYIEQQAEYFNAKFNDDSAPIDAKGTLLADACPP
jgi:hypothetical protein